MAFRVKRRQWIVTFGLGVVLGLAGCNRQGTPTTTGSASPGSGSAAPSAEAGKGGAAAQAGLHQPFKEAVLLEPPDTLEIARPPEKTKAGKSVGKLFETVAALWDQIPFVTPEGKRLSYTATIHTELGAITIELWPDVAPNHVCNFIALARAGYYDGLEFHRSVHEEFTDQKGTFLDYIEAGSPLGTGDPGDCSIGYWLKPELNEKQPELLAKQKHEEGTVGAWHGDMVETAACRFYITLSKAPGLDNNYTVFGKVVRGLDVARAISNRPRLSDNADEDRPREPVVMRQVVIECTEATPAGRPTN